jgi:hypothetical protein
VYLHIPCTAAFRDDVIRAAGDAHYSGFVRACVRKAIVRDPQVEERFRLVQLSPRNGSSVDQVLEWLLARNPVVNDLVSREGDLQVGVRRALYAALPSIQARRVERVLMGHKLEEIGKDEGCSRQAVHAAIGRALGTLRESRPFIAALCEALPDSGLTTEQLVEAIRGQED